MENDTLQSDNGRGYSLVASAVGVLIGLVGSILIWVGSPYVDHVIGVSELSGSYLPVGALFLLMLLVLGINPLLRLVALPLVLRRPQMAIVVGMWLVASVLPGYGGLDVLPYSLAQMPQTINQQDKSLWDNVYKGMNLHPSLFPERLEYGQATPACEAFSRGLNDPSKDPIPWNAWKGGSSNHWWSVGASPLISWGTFLTFAWLMMLGMALIVFPQWRRNERLLFPLLTINQSLIEAPEKGRLLPPLMCKRSFWIAAGAVFTMHLLTGLQIYSPDTVPAIPLKWDLSRFFTEGIFQGPPTAIRVGQIYFILVGIAFFVPNRVSISVWFFALAYSAYAIIGKAYFPPFPGNAPVDHRLGGAMALTAIILWLGRRHWWHVLKCMFRWHGDESDRRDRISGWMFFLGAAGVWGWLIWAGVSWLWALGMVGFGFMVSLLVTRLVAETGLPFFRIHEGKQIALVKLMPFKWVSAPVIFFSWIMIVLFSVASRVSLAAMAVHAVGMDEQARPRRQARLAMVLMVLMVIGLVVCGATHLYINYHHNASLDGAKQPLNGYGSGFMGAAQIDLREWASGKSINPVTNEPVGFNPRTYPQGGHILFGILLVGGLMWLCMVSPRWPIHPIGILLANTSYGNSVWWSFFFGWLLKVIVTRLGGSRLYQRARAFFLGLIIGEVFAAIFWGLAPVLLVLLDKPYREVNLFFGSSG